MEHPTKIGPYEVLSLLGSGGMGRVYKVSHESTGQVVALKVLPAEYAREARFLMRFRREIDVLKRLDHPNVARILDAGSTEENVHYYAMEFVDGVSLDQILARDRRLDIEQALTVVRQCARAMEYAHANKVIHRDIKPGNILVGMDWHVKITDFGIARPEDGTRVTTTGSILGTAEYMSPEQAEGRKVDGRSDVYSLGAVLYQMLAGRPPFVGNTALEVMKHHRFSIPDSPKSFNPEVSINLATIIMKMLAKDAAQRFDSMTAVLRALEILERSGLKTEGEAQEVDRRRRRSLEHEQRASKILHGVKWGALGVACLLALVFWYARTPAAETPRQKFDRAAAALASGQDNLAKVLLFEVLESSADNPELYEEARQKLHVVTQKELARERAQAEISAKLLTGRYRKTMNQLVALQYYQEALALLENGERELALRQFEAIAALFGDTEWGAQADQKAQDIRKGAYTSATKSAREKPATAPASREAP